MKKPQKPIKPSALENHRLYLIEKNSIVDLVKELPWSEDDDDDDVEYTPSHISIKELVRLVSDSIPKSDLDSAVLYPNRYCDEGITVNYTHKLSASELEKANAEYEQKMSNYHQQMEEWNNRPKKAMLTKRQKLEKQLSKIKEELNGL